MAAVLVVDDVIVWLAVDVLVEVVEVALLLPVGVAVAGWS